MGLIRSLSRVTVRNRHRSDHAWSPRRTSFTSPFNVPVTSRVNLAVRWMLDQGISTALWGARRPDQLRPVDEVTGWSLDASTKAEIDRILRETITDPVGPEFMAPPSRNVAA